MLILGINATYHEISASIIRDGHIVAAVEEERFNRIKHGKLATTSHPFKLPVQSIKYCLNAARALPKDVEYIAYAFNPKKIDDAFQDGTYKNHLSSLSGPQRRALALSEVPAKLSELGFRAKFVWIDHHISHAASAFYVSSFEHAAVLIIDGIGESDTTATFFAENTKLRLLDKISYPNSVGLIWEFFSVFLGFTVYDAAKIMGLAAYGDPSRYKDALRKLISLQDNGTFWVNNDIFRLYEIEYYPPSVYYENVEQHLKAQRRHPDQPIIERHADIAAALQDITNEIVLHLTSHLYRKTRSKNLCVAGGVALNCVTNQALVANSPFVNVYFQPAAHDAGTSLGAALYLWHHQLSHSAFNKISHVYYGPSFDRGAILRSLIRSQVEFEEVLDIEVEIAKLISEGEIVALFQGAMEFGPRALGNRSILADPRYVAIKAKLNAQVKFREDFRPFGASVLNEYASQWFEISESTNGMDFMLVACPVKQQTKAKAPAIVHVDGTSRIQIVKKHINSRFHKVIEEFYKLTSIPLVVNTSFNVQEPIVCSPQDAIRTFQLSQIDCLAIGDFMVRRR